MESILACKYTNFEVIIIDNNSTDNSLSIIREFLRDKRIKLIPLKSNIHYAPANNLGIRYSKGDLIVFLNNDTRVDLNWLSELEKVFDADGEVAAAQCILPAMIGHGKASLGGTLDYSGRLIPIEHLWQKRSDLKLAKRIFWGIGAALVIRRSILEKVNAFDPDLPTDEVDICWRINLNGGKIVVAPTAIVYHFGSGSWCSRLSAERMYYAEISMLTALFRNFAFQSLFKALFYWLSFLPFAIILDIAVRKRADVLLFRFKAYFHVFRKLRKVFSQRLFVQKSIRKVSDNEIRTLMLKPNPLLYLSYSQRS